MKHYSIRILLPLSALFSIDAQTAAPSGAPTPTTTTTTEPTNITLASILNATASEANASISGQVFFDSNNNGIRDTDLDYALPSIPISLHSCPNTDANVSDAPVNGTNDTLLADTLTDTLGQYSFPSLDAGSYRIAITDIPSWYTFSSAWNGATNESGTLLFPQAQSVVDPNTQSSLCFDVVGGMERGGVDVGMRLDVPPVTNPIPGPVGSLVPTAGGPSGAPSVAGTMVGTTASTIAASGNATVASSGNATVASSGNVTAAPSGASTSFSTIGEIVIVSPSPTFPSPTNAPTTIIGTLTNAPTLPPAIVNVTTTMPPTINTANGNGTDVFPGGNQTVGENSTMTPSETPSMFPSAYPTEAPSNMTTSGIPTPSPMWNETNESVPSIAPSNQTMTTFPTPTRPSTNETAEPTTILTTPSPTTVLTTASPTKPPRTGDLIGPVTTTGLRITLTGISALENDTAWGEYTASHIENYFSIGYDVWDVSVDIAVRGQTPGNKRVLTERRREQQEGEPSVQVIYEQTTTYRTDAGRNTEYVITEPFANSLDQARYILYLSDRSPFYAAVTAVSPVTLPDEEGSNNDADQVVAAPAPAPSGESDKTISIIIGVCVAVGAVLFLGGLYLVYKRRQQRGADNHEAEAVNNGNSLFVGGPAGMGVDLETGSRMDGQQQGSKISLPMNEGIPPQNRIDDDNVSSTASGSFQPPPGETLEVIAPAGKLGVVVDIPPDRKGPPFVCDIRESSPLYGQLIIGDKIFAVDNEDVRKMSAIKVSKLLAQKSENPERVITVFREHEG